MRTLYLLRHGEAGSQRPGEGDRDRGLLAAGRRAVEQVGAHLEAREPAPSLVLCSAARRAVETLAAVRPFLSLLEEQCEPGLYLAGSESLLARIAEVDDSHAAVLVVGHNPGLGHLAFDLVRPSDAEDYAQFQRSFPTAALAVLECAVEGWCDLALGRAQLAEFVTPESLAARR